jgi:hypothetical protein
MVADTPQHGDSTVDVDAAPKRHQTVQTNSPRLDKFSARFESFDHGLTRAAPSTGESAKTDFYQSSHRCPGGCAGNGAPDSDRACLGVEKEGLAWVAQSTLRTLP